MRITITFFLSLAMVLLTRAQMTDIPAQLQWGIEEKAPAGSRIAQVITAGEWGAYTWRYKPSALFSPERFWIEHYSSFFNLEARYEVKLPGGDDTQVEEVLSLNRQIYLLTSRLLEGQPVSQLYARGLSPRGQVTGEDILLAEVTINDASRRRLFDLEFNRDSSAILVYNQKFNDRNQQEQFAFRVFDAQFQLLWSRDVVLPYQDLLFDILEYRIGPDGNVVLLGRSRSQDRQEAPTYSLFTYTDNGKVEQEYRLALREQAIKEISFNITTDGTIIIAGFYAPTPRSDAHGTFLGRINPAGKSSSGFILTPFTEELGMSSNRRDEQRRSVFRPRNIIPRTDGGAVIIAEQFFRNTIMRGSFQGVRYDRQTFYGDLLVLNLSADGELDWGYRIPKRQSSLNDGGAFSSFAEAIISDRLYFIYNDDPRNFSPDRRRQYNLEASESVVTLTEIQLKGGTNTVPLFLNENTRTTTRPRMCRQVGARQMLVYGERGRWYHFGLLTFQ